MSALVRLAAVLVLAGATATLAYGRLQPSLYCWVPDVEFPIACDDEEDEDDEFSPSLRP